MENPKSVSASNPKAVSRSYKRRTRNVFIHKPMQREFTFVLIALLMISTLAIGLVIHHTIHEAVMGGGFRFGKINAYEILSDVSYQLIIRVAGILFVTLIVMGVFGILFLHRVAGPVYRFRQTFAKVNRGEVPPAIKLREGDFFGETADEVNRLLKRLTFEREKSGEIKEKLNKMIASNPSGSVAKDAQEMKDLMDRAPESK